jgi:hypothetical protein
MAGPRHHDRLARLDDAPGDAFPDAVAHAARGLPAQPRRHFDGELPRVRVEKDDAGAEKAVPLLEELDHPRQGGLEVQRRAQRLAHFEQVAELADLGRRAHHRCRPV